MVPEESPNTGRRVRLALAAVIVFGLIAFSAFAIGRLSGNPGTPSTTSAEAGFSRDMQVHHNQAVEMSLIVRNLTDNAEIRLLAYDIATSQGNQSGQMLGWLNSWQLPQAEAEPSMTWMTRPPVTGSAGHEGMEGMDGMDGGNAAGTIHEPGAPMPGLATFEQMQGLTALTGVDAERYFLELMIAHHEGGVLMAEAVLERSNERVVVDLASSIIAAQSSEIRYMTELLAERNTG
ncbi:MAG: DUF305 domain-containing protein [Microbacteriaceae bacterium]